MGRKLASVDFIDFMDLTDDTGIIEIKAPARFINKSLIQINVRQKYGVTIVAIRRGEAVIVSPGGTEVIQKNDLLVVLGRTEDCQKLRG